MQLRKFRGRDMSRVMVQVTAALGEDAMILRTSETEVFAGYGSTIEVIAVGGADMDRLRKQLVVDARRPKSRNGGGPLKLAFVGPPGSGKTTAVLKLILDAQRDNDLSVGVVTLDTYRAGALDEIQLYTELAKVPLEVVYSQEDVLPALKKLRGVDIIFIDTPGFGGGRFDDGEWEDIVQLISPDEVHLCLRAGLRMDVGRHLAARFEAFEPSHLLLTHLDEVPEEAGVADLMLALELPARWVGEGANMEHSLIPAELRAFNSLGLPAPPAITLEVV